MKEGGRMDPRTSSAVLVCPPPYFGVYDDYNSHMHASRKAVGGKDPVDHEKAQKQWTKLVRMLQTLGVDCFGILARSSLPDMVFTANFGLVHPQKESILLSSFFVHERRGEILHAKDYFKNHLGYGTEKIRDPKAYFEGGGDALFHGDELLIGWGFRTNKKGAHYAEEFAGAPKTHLLRLVDSWFYHLDTCLCSVDGKIFYYPGAFDEESRKVLNKNFHTIQVSKEDALNFFCNGIPVYKNGELVMLIVNAEPTTTLKLTLNDLEIPWTKVCVSEFMKSGGGPRCLTLFLHSKA
mgnify:CR=1 FL=1